MSYGRLIMAGLLLGLPLLVLTPGLASAGDASQNFSNIDIEEPYREYLLAARMLMEYAGTKFIKLEDGRIVTISVAMTDVKGNSPKERMRQRKVCRAKALKSFLEETKGIKVVAFSRTKDETRVVVEDGVETGTSSFEFLDLTLTEAEGWVQSMPVVGTWMSKDGAFFYLALGKILDAPAKKKTP